MPRQERTKSGTGIYHVMLGMKNNGTFGAIDSLTISYDGNQLVKVTDAAEALNYSDALDFHDGDDTACEYDYDSNGALTRDSNRGINGITYDYGHHPNYINMNMTSGPRNITNDYTPDGRKLLSKHVMSIPKVNGYIRKTTTDLYIDGLMLRGDTTLLWRFDGGYVDLNANGTPTRWNYYIADHLGSTRMVVDSNDSIRETINYYPFGSEMRISNPAQMSGDTSHPFRFTGKELDRQNSLNMYDFGARLFDVAGVPMWTSVDPLAEKYYHVSPYAYCGNNPIMFIDPDGKFFGPGDMFAKLDDAAKDFGKCYNNISIKKNKEYSTSFYKKTLPNGEVNYSYVEPTEGGAAGSSAKIYIKRDANGKATATNNVTNEKAVATGHTHGAYDKDYHIGNDIFSGTTKDGKPLVGDDERKKVKDSTKDIGSSNVSGIQDYVVTPNGSLQNYNPATGSVRLVSQDMPKDINDPNKVDDAMKMYK